MAIKQKTEKLIPKTWHNSLFICSFILSCALCVPCVHPHVIPKSQGLKQHSYFHGVARFSISIIITWLNLYQTVGTPNKIVFYILYSILKLTPKKNKREPYHIKCLVASDNDSMVQNISLIYITNLNYREFLFWV